MEIGIVILLIVAFIAAIWAFMGISQMKQKIFTILLIALILFVFLSFFFVFKGKNISIDGISDIKEVAQTYFSWVLNAFNNVKTITADAIKLNWDSNSTT